MSRHREPLVITVTVRCADPVKVLANILRGTPTPPAPARERAA